MLKKSLYNFEFEFQGKKYLHNLLATSLVEVTEDVLTQGIQSPSSALAQSLVENGFLVDEDLDEQRKFEYYFDATRLGHASRTLKITLLPTYSCNLACPYCYQGQEKHVEKMDLAGIERVLRFLDHAVREGKENDAISRVGLSLYGGEPLLDKQALEKFCDGACAIVNDCGLPVMFDMTTNLTLLDDKAIELIRKYNIFILENAFRLWPTW